MAKKVINPFEHIDRITLTSISTNPDPIKIEFKTSEYFRDTSGRIIPTKCLVLISGTVRDYSDTDKFAEKIARKTLRALRTASFFIHGKDKWYKIHHDMVSLLLNIYQETDGIFSMKIKTIETKSNRQTYEAVCEFFGITPEPKEDKNQEAEINE